MRKYLLVSISLFFFTSVWGQDFEDIHPVEIPTHEGEVIRPDKKDPQFPDGVDDNKVLVKELKGLTFVADPHSFMDRLPEFSDGIEIEGLFVPDEKAFIKEMQVPIGKPLTFSLLKKIKKATTEYYKDHNFPLVGVTIPTEQDISQGRVILLVVIAKLGNVEVENIKYQKPETVTKHIKTKEGQRIQSDKMLEDLTWINMSSPFRQANLLYERGDTVGLTDVVLDVRDRYPVRPYAGYENRGYNIGGDSRYFVGVNVGNLFNSDQQLNYQFMSADKTDRWWGMSGNYVVPLPWRCSFMALGSFINSKASVARDIFPRGKAWQAGGRYTVFLKPSGHYRHELEFGYDFKRTNNFLDFGIEGVGESFIDISHFFVGYEGRSDDKWGETTFGSTLYASPGRMTHYNKDEYFRQERSGARANYIYNTYFVDRKTRFPADFSWVVNFKAQWATGPLVPTEEFDIGGYSTVRGYDENEIIGDNGFLIRNEIRAPAFKFIKMCKMHGELQFLAFVDYGWAADLDPNVLERSSQFLASIGPGLRYDFETYLSIRFDWAVQLNRVPSLNDHHDRFHVGAIMSY